MKKLFFLIVFLFFYYTHTHANNFVYPIQTMSKPSCRFEHFSTLWSDCKIQLPILKTSEYERYKNDEQLYRRVYTVLYGASYEYGWDVGYGGHSWIDIASAAGTPVWSISHGKVVFAGISGTWGNVVRIEHDVNGRKIYSVYAHLSKIDVSAGENIPINTKIGEVGTTGNSTGNHLHFQIDTTQTRSWTPWWRIECTEKNSWKLGNSNMCLDELRKNTLDPIYFLETNGSIVPSAPPDTWNTYIPPPPPNMVTIPPVSMLTREEILKREMDEFLRLNKVEIELLNIGGNIELGKTADFRITVTDLRRRRPFTGSFPGEMHFKYDAKKMDIFPMAIYRVENGKRDFTVTPKATWVIKLEIFLGESLFKTFSFQVFDTKKSLSPASARTIVKNQVAIGNQNLGVIFFQDTAWTNLIGVNVSGTYRLTSNTDHLVFCKKTIQTLQRSCRYSDMKKNIEFSSQDAYKWVFLFTYATRGRATSTLKVTNQQGKVLFQKQVGGVLPNDVPNFHPYADSLARMSLLVSFPGMMDNYFFPEKEISQADWYTLLENMLFARSESCPTDDCRSTYLQYLTELSNVPRSRYTSLSRYEFVELVGRYLQKKSSSPATVFRDISQEEQKVVEKVFGNETWKDQFGVTKYFQPKKNISRSEAVFILELVK